MSNGIVKVLHITGMSASHARLNHTAILNEYVYMCRELECKEKQDDNQNGGDAAKIASKHVRSNKHHIYICIHEYV